MEKRESIELKSSKIHAIKNIIKRFKEDISQVLYREFFPSSVNEIPCITSLNSAFDRAMKDLTQAHGSCETLANMMHEIEKSGVLYEPF